MNEELAAVRAANQSFYRAMAGGDLVEMESVWLHGSEVVCIHPGCDRLRGWDAIRRAWADLFSYQGSVPVEPADVRVAIGGEMAWVDCDEVLRRDHGLDPTRANRFLEILDDTVAARVALYETIDPSHVDQASLGVGLDRIEEREQNALRDLLGPSLLATYRDLDDAGHFVLPEEKQKPPR